MSSILLGCIADDFTGATDLANNLVRTGMRVVQTVGVPDESLTESADAVVVSLKSRTIAPNQAVQQSLAALAWLRGQGAKQIYFKYCSTFDSTEQGNIGPVTDALMQALGAEFTIATPAFPDAGRTVYQGYLFVGNVLLNESGMQDHPLTPMRDPNLVRVLKPQTAHSVGLVDYRATTNSAAAVSEQFEQLRRQGVGIAIVDAVGNDDLLRIGQAAADLELVTGGSGLAIGLPANFGIEPNAQAAKLPEPTGQCAIVSGSCSRATQAQVANFIEQGGTAIAMDPVALSQDSSRLEHYRQQALSALAVGPVLVYSTTSPEQLVKVQAALGAMQAGEMVEKWIASIACSLVQAGVGQLIVAGGETSGAVVQALGVEQLRIGAQIDPGVPWCYGYAKLQTRSIPLHISLKSGNFGAVDFFTKAFKVLVP
ncbi:3-oxo-tetronate kinase [Orrella daihaiensis]|uniref:3-oxo-tetronate kinase n=1 Tax=Orrella daihaiensis TaxID=2782176 RepID=A0ABY4AH76_9BURK|nr:3-oxo-tetronate kinase [Orrella daihaiensis]UOD49632.1 four-carbon acid sugar kinase family protein [Orrella daihaiensis]